MNWGGQEYRTLLEHQYLNETGHQSWIMCHRDSALYVKANDLDITNVVSMNLSRAWNTSVAFQIAGFCTRNKIDVINSHGSRDSTLCLLAWWRGTPLVRSRQISSGVKNSFSYQRLCSHVIAAADVIKQTLIDSGVDGAKISVVGEGVDLEEYNPHRNSSKLREEFDIQQDEAVVVNIGMMRGDKGQQYFIQSAIDLHRKGLKAKFFIVGEGAGERQTENRLKQMVSDSGLQDKILFPGYRDDVNLFIHLADIVVVSSVAVEAQSRIVPQAFATQRTVVSTNIGGLTELVIDGTNGLVVQPRDSDGMGQAIARLISDETLRNRLAKHAYELAKSSLSFEHMMKKTTDVYKRLTQN